MKLFLLVAALLGPLAAANSWVLPQGLPEGHNGGFRERIVDPVADVKPHIVLVLFDDYGSVFTLSLTFPLTLNLTSSSAIK